MEYRKVQKTLYISANRSDEEVSSSVSKVLHRLLNFPSIGDFERERHWLASSQNCPARETVRINRLYPGEF
ncbi:hypothetical protein [Leptolyngbya sp. FACHB-711]|uniref:hypothetical protein n=1 Tax=unclassified Leptolyngbya TaxID=2650499 RepID=UPI0016879B6C|nr:hypothetical protein [Leptolyngbya sp. FACHB-711]MBD1851471.1 hypothetical protein [Cyanobacteria bacterium FACHB-502]MBD2023716.1 hypothetical protein [Leptolyngbya sp. FACHB-711]